MRTQSEIIIKSATPVNKAAYKTPEGADCKHFCNVKGRVPRYIRPKTGFPVKKHKHIKEEVLKQIKGPAKATGAESTFIANNIDKFFQVSKIN